MVRRHEIEVELRAAKELAETSSHAKTQFLANTSHELRTPLNAIIGFAEIIANEIHGANSVPKYREYAFDIFNSGQDLLSTLNDILDMAKIDAGEVKLVEDEIDVEYMIEEAVRAFSEEARTSKTTLTIDVAEKDLIIKADERLMRQVLDNLISNALKFTHDGGKVDIKVVRLDDGGVELSVCDDGIGIPEDQIDIIVEPFNQIGEALSRNQDGIGLGLPIVRSLVELHGGQFTLTSAIGEGTKATITWPKTRTVELAA